jgi:hypothetical protein
MGIKITTDELGVKVRRSDRFKFPSYYIKISRQVDGQWVNEFQDIRFRKGVEVEDGDEIIIHDAFPTLDVWKKDGEVKSRCVWQILDFHYRSEMINHAPKEAVMPEDLPDSFAAADDDVPF